MELMATESPDWMKRFGIGWFNFERRNWVALSIACGLLGYSAGNGHTTQNAITNISDQLGQVKSAENCEHKRADKAIGVAKMAIVAASAADPDAAVPDPHVLPLKDCPHK